MINKLKDTNAICPICLSDNTMLIGDPDTSTNALPYITKQYKVYKCKKCAFYFVFPVISFTKAEWGKLYGNEYFGKMTSWHEKSREKDRIRRINWLIGAFDGNIDKFLDIGCGEGYILIEAQRRGWTVTGIDISDNRIASARCDSLQFIKGSLFDASFPDNYFDCIYMDSVLEHLLDPLRTVNEINRILRPGGVLYLGVPNEDSLFNDFRKVIFNLLGRSHVSVRTKPFKTPYHVIGFTEKSIKNLFLSAGFEFQKLRIFGHINEWLKFEPSTKVFYLHLMLIPLNLISKPLKKMVYIDAVLKKSNTPNL